MHHLHLVQTIGATPMVELRHLSPKPEVRLFAKLEGWNPTGSVKDRIVRHMLVHAERDGRIVPGDTVIEASTGNTGIALAMVGRALGYNATIVMPENVWPEIPRTLAVYGAEVHWVPAGSGVTGAMDVARKMAAESGSFMLDQFCNEHNARAHYVWTGAEILEDVPQVDIFVAGLGTGGTLMGTGRRLKEANPSTKVIAVEPHPGNQLQGLKSLADGFIPPILDLHFLDGKILVRSGHAFRAARLLMEREGIFGGISAGAVLHAGLKFAERIDRGNIVMIFADSGWKYLDTNLWSRGLPETEDEESLDDIIWW
ncbi:MAG TPA: cysteine synthase family protein [Dehalococcoidia bacterium]|jgi:cysteine synthase B|nr:cysteine synthase family protein [Dehalococcoidia bacterium]